MSLDGPLIPYNLFTEKDKKLLTITDKTENKYLSFYPRQMSYKNITLCDTSTKTKSKYVCVPWDSLSKITNSANAVLTINNTDCTTSMIYKKEVELLDYQKELVNYVNNYLQKYKICNKFNRMYIKLNTGLGKSFIGMYLIKMLKLKTLIVVPTERIMQQWKEMLLEYGFNVIDQYEISKMSKPKKVKKTKKTNTTTDISYNCDNCDIEIDNTVLFDIAIFIINTAVKLKTDYTSQFGLCLLDEAHEYYTKIHKSIFWTTQPIQTIFGLSATPYGAQFAENVFHFLGCPIDGDTLIKIKKSSFIIDVYVYKYDNLTDIKNHIIEQKTSEGDIVEYHDFGYMNDLKCLTKDPIRFKLIKHAIDFIFSQNKQHRIFIFSELREHLDELEKYINSVYGCDNIKVFTPEIIQLKGGVTTEVYDQAARDANIIPTTYGYSRRGISIKSATAIIMATPRKKNIKQICGRILRKGSDESIRRIIVDINDTTNYFNRQLTARKKVYTEEKFNVFHLKFDSNGEQESEIIPINQRFKKNNTSNTKSSKSISDEIIYDE